MPIQLAATEKALTINDKDFRVWANLVATYLWLKDDDKAAAARERELALLESSVKSQPQDAISQSELASIYAQQKKRDEALARIQTALALAPDDARVLFNVGAAYEVLGDRPSAIRFVEKALQKGYPQDDLSAAPELQTLLQDPKFKSQGK